jgi:hypothetical protein
MPAGINPQKGIARADSPTAIKQLADLGNQNKQQARPVPGMTGRSCTGGTFLIPFAQAQSTTTTASKRYPWDLIIGGATGGTVAVMVEPGTINNVLPSNIFTALAVSDTATNYIQADCTAAGGEITGISLSVQSTPPGAPPVALGGLPTAFSVLIGGSVSGTPYKVAPDGPITALPTLAYQTDKTAPTPGVFPQNNYYTWAISW